MIVGRRRRGQQRMPWSDGIIDSMAMNLSKLRERVKDRGAWCVAVHGVAKSHTWFSNWTATGVHVLTNTQMVNICLWLVYNYTLSNFHNLHTILPVVSFQHQNSTNCYILVPEEPAYCWTASLTLLGPEPSFAANVGSNTGYTVNSVNW